MALLLNKGILTTATADALKLWFFSPVQYLQGFQLFEKMKMC